MLKVFQNELEHLINEFKKLDSKISIIFFSSIILFTVSWYFSTPKFFKQNLEYYFTPVNTDIYAYGFWFLFDTVLFLVIPILIIKFIFKEPAETYGLKFNIKLNGIVVVLFTLIIFLPVIILISSSENFVQYFPLMQSAKNDLSTFVIYELLFILFIFSWEFIFRGFLLFGLEEKFGVYSIFIQMIPFVILHNGKPFLETFASIFGGIFLGYLALRYRTIIYGFLIHSSILVILDLISFIKNL